MIKYAIHPELSSSAQSWKKNNEKSQITSSKKSPFLKQSTYGTKCVGRIVTKSMSNFLHLCDCSLPYCVTLEAWNWFVARQHLNASHPRSPIWPTENVTIFSGNYFWKTLNGHYSSTVRDFDLIPKLRARPEYQLSSGTIYIPRDLRPHFFHKETVPSSLHTHSLPQSNAINYKF
jgi:hypothetical protein